MINRLILDQNVLLADHLPHAGGRLSLTPPLPPVLPLCNSLNFYKNLTGTAGVGGASVDLRPPSRVSRRETPPRTDRRSKAPQAAEADDKEVPVPIRGTVFNPPPLKGLTSAGHFLLYWSRFPMLSERAHLCRTLRVSSCAPTWCRCMGTCPFPPLHPPLAPPPGFLLSTGPIYSRAITVPVLGALAADLEDQHHPSSRQRGPTSWAEPTRPAVGRFVIQPTPTHSFSCFFLFLFF